MAHDQGKIIGFAGGMLAGSDFEVTDVVVDEARRHEKIGTRLLVRIAYDAQMLGAHSLSLEVSVNNEVARSLYAKLGFQAKGQRCGYYGKGYDAIIMKAGLPLVSQLPLNWGIFLQS